jgi:hypothetical protein
MMGVYNVIMNNVKYKTDLEIIITGMDDKYQDVVRNVYAMYGNVIMSTMSKYNIKEVDNFIKSKNIPNVGGIYYNVHTILEGLKKSMIRKNIIITNGRDLFSDISAIHKILSPSGDANNSDSIVQIINTMTSTSSSNSNSTTLSQNNHNNHNNSVSNNKGKNVVKPTPIPVITPIIQNTGEKIIITNIGTRKISKLRLCIGDHLIAGKHSQLMMAYSNTIGILNDKVTGLRKKMRLEYTPEQIYTLGFLIGGLDYLAVRDDNYVKKIMSDTFQMININELGYYRIQCGQNYMTPASEKSIYNSMCEVNDFGEL